MSKVSKGDTTSAKDSGHFVFAQDSGPGRLDRLIFDLEERVYQLESRFLSLPHPYGASRIDSKAVYSAISPPPSYSVEPGVSDTHQSFKDECDINNIVANNAPGDLFMDPTIRPTLEPRFLDCTTGTSFQDSLDHVIRIKDAFADLPSELRRRFDNDPSVFVDYLKNADNFDEAVKLGLLPPSAFPAPAPVSQGDAVAPTASPPSPPVKEAKKSE